MSAKTLSQVVEAHKRYWDDEKRDMYKYKRAYECKFWDNMNDPSQIAVQTSDAYGYIESYISSLFTKNPGVVVKNGLKGTGDTKKAQALANDFLAKQRTPIEDASRLALIYPNAFVKMFPKQDSNIYNRVDLTPVAPWQVIVDRDALRWEDSRYIGHVYYMSLPQAIQRFGNKKFNGVEYEQYFGNYLDIEGRAQEDIDGSADMFKYIEVCEFYDMQNDMLYFWSEQWGHDKFLDKTPIPFRDADNNPIVPIIPLYFNRLPDRPLIGYSAMSRIYDQIFEINMIRTFQANAVRKASRQYIVKKGILDEEQIAQITSGIDGLFIEIDDDDLAGAIRPLPQNPTPPELEFYYQSVQNDKDKGSIMAPFTRGESTRASATEIAALAAYTSTEVGRLARERDTVIERISKVYLAMISLYINDEQLKDLVIIDGEPVVIKPEDLNETFYVYAVDAASTPISETVRKREFIQSVPLLQGLGVPQRTLIKELINTLGLPDYIYDETIAAMDAQETEMSNVSAADAGGVKIAPDAREAVQSTAQAQAPIGPGNLGIPGRRNV